MMIFGNSSSSSRSGYGSSRSNLRNLVTMATTAALLAVAFLGQGTPVSASSRTLFSSNVVTLTSSNWKEHVLDNPHMVLVNICREGWGYCQRLQPEWEKLAASVKGVVTIAYWDTGGGSRPPRLLGEYSGTPTIRLFSPKRKPRTPGSTSEKTVMDYQHGERTSSDIRKFLEQKLPNYVEPVSNGRKDYDRLHAKAASFGLPLVVVFTTKAKAKTSTTLKWLSAEYRRKVLLVEVPPTEKNKGLREELFGTAEGEGDAQPALYVVPTKPSEAEAESETKFVHYQGGKPDFTRRKLDDFVKQHALSEAVLKPIAATGTGTEETKQKEEEQQQDKHDEF